MTEESPSKSPRKRRPTEPGAEPQKDQAGVPESSNLPAKLPDDVREELERAGVDPQKLPRIEEMLAVRFFSYRGSWPPPEIISGYEQVLPGSGMMILETVKARSDARIALEREESQRSDARMRRAQNFGFTIAAGSLVLAGVLGIWGNGWAAIVIAVAGLCVGIGGPSVARVIADRVYLDLQRRTAPNQRPDRADARR